MLGTLVEYLIGQQRTLFAKDRLDGVAQCLAPLVEGGLHNLLEQFLDAEIIEETKAEGRRRSYILTKKGRELLDNECKRLESLVSDYHRYLVKEDAE